MTKCGDCGQTGHTSTACKNGKVGSFSLFGAWIKPTADQSEDDDCLLLVDGVGSSNHEHKNMDVLKIHTNEHSSPIDLDYLSDEHEHGPDKKKGVPWTELEHKLFLDGLGNLGKGHWGAISKHYVQSRTPTQVASHAQKHFLRVRSPEDTKKRRRSLFDMPLNECSAAPKTSVRPPVAPKAQTYGFEGYNHLSHETDHHNNHIPAMNYGFQESIHPLNRRSEKFAVIVSKPLPITNYEERWSIQKERWSTQEPDVEVEGTKD
ncbi:hypothetical protein L1987_15577 [Smallanthus sonchifolius]|uniref:Uncharacterized protein n=1 Tax=Smallanthus sonchifolius TaxID=185202 RepID=A0ACB9J6H6_9ASTR|nr:hypothetical protein L1987_15577 [Smallanthus sonchifolius]